MITKVTQENLAKYTKLFEAASAELTKANKWDVANDANKGQITSLKQYFHYIADLAQIDTKYTVLPVDEDVFEIDANTREIAVPSSFRKNGVGVQNDHIAEILYFKIDRYYDSQDLGLCKIYIQWQNASGELGLTREYSRDVDSEEGKLIFGWPISESITHSAGPVQFAVRFYTAANENDLDTLSYSFGTKTQSVVINPTLDFDLEAVSKEDLKLDIINRLTNSGLEGSVIADTPAFYISYHLNENNEVEAGTVLGAVGYSPDPNDKVGINENIGYKWYYISDSSTDAVGVLVEGGMTYMKLVDLYPSASYNAIIPYYVNSANEGEQINCTLATVDSSNFDNQKNNLYVQVSTYKIPEKSADILGQYYVVIENRVPYATNNPATVSSAKVSVNGPDAAVITTDLNANVEMTKDKSTFLSIVVDNTGSGSYSYEWYFKEYGTTGDYTKLESTSNPYLIPYGIENEGEYKVKAVRSKNNNSKTAESKPCMVFIGAKPPVASGKMTYKVGETCEVVVDTSEGTHPGNLTYRWKYQSSSTSQPIELEDTKLDITFANAGTYTLIMTNTKVSTTAINQTNIFVEE